MGPGGNRRHRGKLLQLTAGTLLLALFAFLRPLRVIDNLWYDLHFIVGAADASDQVVIVGIDPESIERFGALPWSRSIMASLVDKIAAAQPAATALDFLFPRREGAAENDSLAAVFSRTSPLVLPFRAEGITARASGERQSLPPELHAFRFQRMTAPDKYNSTHFYSAAKISAADTFFVKYARYGGFLNVSTNSRSRKLREVVQVIRAGDDYVPSFGLAAVAAYLKIPPEKLTLDGSGRVIIGSHRVPLSSYAATTSVNFRNIKHPVKTISAAALLDGTADPKLLRGKLVFVGVTDPAAGADVFTTPAANRFPGVAVWATVALDILDGRILRGVRGFPAIPGYLLMLALFPGCAMVFSSGKWRTGLAVSAGILAAGFGISIMLFSSANVMWNFSVLPYAWLFFIIWFAASPHRQPENGG